jgi:hypothetical protein
VYTGASADRIDIDLTFSAADQLDSLCAFVGGVTAGQQHSADKWMHQQQQGWQP